MMAVIVVRGPGCSGLRRKRALLLLGGLECKAQNSCTDHKYCCKNGYLHLKGSSGCISIPR